MKLFSRNKNHSDISIIWEEPGPDAFVRNATSSNFDKEYISNAVSVLATKPGQWGKLFKVRTSNAYMILGDLESRFPSVIWKAEFNREADGEPAYSIYGCYQVSANAKTNSAS